MYFDFKLCEKVQSGNLLYIEEEYSLFYEPFNSNIGISIICGDYTSLDTIYETNEIVHISGYNSKNSWLPQKLNLPIAKKGKLIANFDIQLIKGVGIDYDRSWKTLFDEVLNVICIGDFNTINSDVCIEFTQNIIAVLRDQQLIAVWAKIKYE